MRTMWMVGLTAGLASVATAQLIVSPPEFNQQTVQFVSAQLVSGPPVTGAPYSAEAANEIIQTLADGNRIVQHASSRQYRDAEGRERRSAMGVIFITDPVAGVRYTLHPDSQTADRSTMPKLISKNAASSSETFFFSTFERRVTEQLGNMFIEGVQAQGKRITTTIPAGQIGNDRPINVVDESWYWPDLQMTIMTKHSDPRSGESNFALKNIQRSNPPLTLFQVPAGYTVKSGPEPFRFNFNLGKTF